MALRELQETVKGVDDFADPFLVLDQGLENFNELLELGKRRRHSNALVASFLAVLDDLLVAEYDVPLAL